MTLLKKTDPKNINISLLSLDNKISKVVNIGKQVAALEEKINNSNIADISALEASVNQNTALINAETNNRELADTALQNNIDGKVDKEAGKGLSTNDFTDADKAKLDSLENTVVDSALSSTSTNPVQNKVVNSALSGKVDKVSGKGLSTNDFTDIDKATLDSLASGGSLTAVYLWSGVSSTGAQTITLNDSILNYKFVLVVAAMYTNSIEQKQTMLIPTTGALYKKTGAAWMFCGTIPDTDRRLRFCFPTATTLEKLVSTGTSSHLPILTDVWGIK
jgi:hypothetical protein